jgi:hypothetical protein
MPAGSEFAAGTIRAMSVARLTHRRGFQFGLGTMFVVVTAVAILAAWAAYNLNWIRQRHVFLAQPEVFAEFNNSPPSTFNRRGNTWPVYAPRGLWLLGERGLVSVWLPPKFWSPQRQAEAARLFPEALLLWVNADGNWVTERDPGNTTHMPTRQARRSNDPTHKRPRVKVREL